MAKNLLIVESPAKAKTIEKILGKDFLVKSCYGHIRDLEKDEMGVDLNKNYEPRYVVSDDKIKVVNELKKLAKSSEEVWLASDEDREGESISWHLAEALGLDVNSTKRIVFHEITAPAIKKAVANPRLINMNLVNAQQARRVLDRLVGFELSPVLWKKVKPSLSAGRVQSVAVRLIVEREREITAFIPTSSFKVEAFFTAPDIHQKSINFKAEASLKLPTKQDAEQFLKSCINANYSVASVEVKPSKRNPAPPFTTSTLQQEASRKLGYGVSKTMLVAQKLYEAGYITYMRTDSVNLSDTARADIENAIVNNYGEKYFKQRFYKNKNETAQEAHEAIRPTYMNNKTIADDDGRRLYELIWRRTIASQMSEAEFEKTTAKINISSNKEQLTATGEVLMFDGFLKVYLEGKDDEEDEDSTTLPPLKVAQNLDFKEMIATERFTKPPARYTEASLVKTMEELGIGRPSTYAPTISTIIKRTYVEKADREGKKRDFQVLKLSNNQIASAINSDNTGAEKQKLFPTDLGSVVTDFLKNHFTQVMDYSFTAQVEDQFDGVAQGKIIWHKMIDGFYKPFHKTIETTLETANRASGERELGKDPETGKKIIARMGRFGAMVQMGENEGEEKPRFATLKKGQSIETISLNEALDLFKLPKVIGSYFDAELSINIGRYGPYIKFGDQFVSIPRGENMDEIDEARAIQIIEEKNQADAPIAMYEGLPVTKGKGRFGPFVKWKDLYINVTKAYDFDNLTQADCEDLIVKKLDKEANRYIQNWEAEKISIQNARWGAIIKFGKDILKITKKLDGTKYTPEDLTSISLDEVKRMIVEQKPNAFDKPLKAAAKKNVTKKAVKKK